MDQVIYLSESHLFKMGGKNLILDVYTSRVFALDEVAFNIVGIAEHKEKRDVTSILSNSYPIEDIENAFDELKEARLLAEEPFDFRLPAPEYAEYEIRNMDLILSQDCNMRCIYCFADKGAFRGKRGFMSVEVGKRAIDFLIERSGKSKSVGLVFFGGEPLLNLSGLKELVQYGNEKSGLAGKKIQFGISTNGILLTDELVDYFNEERINVQISIDGDAETQNINRPLPGKKSSYPVVKEKSTLFLRKTRQQHISARTTITSKSVNRTYENVLHLLSLGFPDIHTETAEGTLGKGFLSREDYDVLKSQNDLIAEVLIQKISENRFFGYNNIVRAMRLLNANGKNMYSCGVGRGYVAVGTNGDVFPCHRFVNNDSYKMGNVLDGTFSRNWERVIHTTTNVLARVPCSSCWARFVCGGDCIAISEDYYDDLVTPNPERCDLIKHVLELSMMVYSTIPKERKPEIEKAYSFFKRPNRETQKERQI